MISMKGNRRALVLLAALLAPWACAAGPGGAEITSLRAVAGRLQVAVSVPAGQHKVTLETRDRLAAGAWVPREVKWADTNGDLLTFSIPMDPAAGVVRVVEEADDELRLPPSFFQGAGSFKPNVSATAPGSGSSTPGDLNGATVSPGGLAGGAPSSTTRSAVESDIWYLDGSTLYFFNQNRALQVIDVTRPEAPRLKGWMPLAAWGEQLYRLPGVGVDGEVWLALLADPGCGTQDEVFLVRVSGGRPELAGRFKAPGQIQASRMVGDDFYAACSSWTTTTDPQGGVSFQSVASVASWDLSNPAAPVRRSLSQIDGYPWAMTATDSSLLISASPYSPDGAEEADQVAVFDISDPSGVIFPRGKAGVRGPVYNKFQMSLERGVLAVVSQDRPGSETVFETFSAAASNSWKRLGSLPLVSGESLFATRFDGPRAYVATYHTVDPLWIVDFSDPTRPVVAGKVESPGFSTYLQPMGDRLLALGDDGWRTVVELFDVSDPAKPALLSEAVLGQGWSWSEAAYDQKAFNAYPDAHLLLVPWQGGTGASWFSGVQLIDWEGDALTPRGVIENGAAARRSALLDPWVLVVSSDHLISSDISDRDKPKEAADLGLTWNAAIVRTWGGGLLEVDDSAAPAPVVRWAPLGDSRGAKSSAVLPPYPVVGVEVHDGMAYVLQQAQVEFSNLLALVTNGVSGGGKANFETNWISVAQPTPGTLTVLSVSNGVVAVQGAVAFTNTIPGSFGNELAWSAYWPASNVIVWALQEGGLFPVNGTVWANGAPSLGAFSFHFNDNNGRELLPFDVGALSAPSALPVVSLERTEGDSSEGGVYAAAGKVFTGRSHSEFVPDSSSGGVPLSTGEWRTGHWMDVVDFADPLNPTRRPPAALPGSLAGVSLEGALVYAVGPDSTTAAGWTNYLFAAAYDGVAVSVAASTPIPDVSLGYWPGWFGGLEPLFFTPVYYGWLQGQGPIVEPDGTVWLVREGGAAGAAPSVEAWAVNVEGTFARRGAASLSGTPTGYHAYGHQLVVREGAQAEFVDLSQPASPVVRGVAEVPCSLNWDWAASDADDAPEMWVARGASGLWRLASGAGP